MLRLSCACDIYPRYESKSESRFASKKKISTIIIVDTFKIKYNQRVSGNVDRVD